MLPGNEPTTHTGASTRGTTATIATFPMLRSYPIRRIAGSVKTMPAAMDSPAEPVVCTMLFSRMVECPSVRKKATGRVLGGRTYDGYPKILTRPMGSKKRRLEMLEELVA